MNFKWFAIGLSLIMIAVFANASTEISGCTTFDSSGVYLLNQSFEKDNGVCFEFNVSNIVLDCQENTIFNNLSSFGTTFMGNKAYSNNYLSYQNLTVKNCNVEFNFYEGAFGDVAQFVDVDGLIIDNVNLSDSAFDLFEESAFNIINSTNVIITNVNTQSGINIGSVGELGIYGVNNVNASYIQSYGLNYNITNSVFDDFIYFNGCQYCNFQNITIANGYAENDIFYITNSIFNNISVINTFPNQQELIVILNSDNITLTNFFINYSLGTSFYIADVPNFYMENITVDVGNGCIEYMIGFDNNIVGSAKNLAIINNGCKGNLSVNEFGVASAYVNIIDSILVDLEDAYYVHLPYGELNKSWTIFINTNQTADFIITRNDSVVQYGTTPFNIILTQTSYYPNEETIDYKYDFSVNESCGGILLTDFIPNPDNQTLYFELVCAVPITYYNSTYQVSDITGMVIDIIGGTMQVWVGLAILIGLFLLYSYMTSKEKAEW